MRRSDPDNRGAHKQGLHCPAYRTWRYGHSTDACLQGHHPRSGGGCTAIGPRHAAARGLDSARKIRSGRDCRRCDNEHCKSEELGQDHHYHPSLHTCERLFQELARHVGKRRAQSSQVHTHRHEFHTVLHPGGDRAFRSGTLGQRNDHQRKDSEPETLQGHHRGLSPQPVRNQQRPHAHDQTAGTHIGRPAPAVLFLHCRERLGAP